MMETTGTSRTPRWLWMALTWLCVGLFDGTQTVVVMHADGMHHAWIRLFATTLLSWLPWALATPLIVRLGLRYPPVQVRPFVTWPIHIAACAAAGLVYSAWVSAMDVRLNPYLLSPPPGPFGHHWIYKFYYGLLAYVIIYGSILAVSYVFHSRRLLAQQETRTALLNEQLSRAQLNALRRQIEPHFIFNTLNAIAGLVREGKSDTAVSMIAGLSDFLRGVVKDSNRQQVPLAEEVEFAQKYLDIQKMRFADRLQLTVSISGELLPAQVPSLILQPMLENAVKHGIARRAQGGAIRISAFRANGMLTLRVYNDGPALPDDWEKSPSGTGLSNVRTRLQGLYGNTFEMRVRNQTPDGVEVSVSVPFVSSSARD
jgi:hypothetical protein